MARTQFCLTPGPVVGAPLRNVRAVTPKTHSRCDSGVISLVAVKREVALPSGGGEGTWRSGSNPRASLSELPSRAGFPPNLARWLLTAPGPRWASSASAEEREPLCQ